MSSIPWYVPIIIILVLLLTIIINIAVAVHKIKRKFRQFKSQMGLKAGESVLDAVQLDANKIKQAQMVEEPRSLNGMTSVFLPLIRKDFPELNIDEVKSKNNSFIKAYLNSLEAGNVDEMKDPQIAQVVKDTTLSIINDLNSQNRRVFYDNIVIHNTVISDYTKNNGMVTIRLQSSVGFINYMLDAGSAVVAGNREAKRETVIQTDYTYIQDIKKIQTSYGSSQSIGLSCPNCGAPINNLGTKFCEYCGTGIKEINIYSWRFTNIMENVDSSTARYF